MNKICNDVAGSFIGALLLNPNSTEVAINSRFFADSQSCLNALNEDLNSKVDLLEIKSVKGDIVTSISETNPLYSNTKEAIEEFKKENPAFDEYLSTWNPHELVRLTFTTEEMDEDSIPILSDEKALMFRYVMHELEDDLLVPEGKLYIENASSMVH